MWVESLIIVTCRHIFLIIVTLRYVYLYQPISLDAGYKYKPILSLGHSLLRTPTVRTNLSSFYYYYIEMESTRVYHPKQVLPKASLAYFFEMKGSEGRPNLPMVKLTYDDGMDVLLLQSPEFNFNTGPYKGMNTYDFRVNGGDCPDLKEAIRQYEDQVNGEIKTFILSSERVPKKLKEKFPDEGPYLRPIFNMDGTAFFRTTFDCRWFDWSGAPLDPKTLKSFKGKYQFIISLRLVFLGDHGQTTYSASLQPKISQIRFKPSTQIDWDKPLFCDFMEDFENDGQPWLNSPSVSVPKRKRVMDEPLLTSTPKRLHFGPNDTTVLLETLYEGDC